MPLRRAWPAVVLTAGLLAVGCGGGGESTTTTTVDLTAGVLDWFEALPADPVIWDSCAAEQPAAWQALGAVDAPPPQLGNMWRGYLEAGTVWAEAVSQGIDAPDMLDAVLAAEGDLVAELGLAVGADLVAETLPLAADFLDETCLTPPQN